MIALILVVLAAGAGVAVYMMSNRKSDTLSLSGSPPVIPDRQPPPRPAPSTQERDTANTEQDPAEELARTAALQDTRGPGVPTVSTPRLTSLHIIDNVHRLHFVATLGRRLVFVFHPYSPDQLVGVDQGLDEDGSNTGPLFDHLAERAIAAGLPDLPARNAQQAFQPASLRTPSIHIRVRFEDGRTWASMYDAEELEQQGLPAGLLELLLDTRALGLQLAPESVKSLAAARPPLLHFTFLDRATQPSSEFRILVDPNEMAMISLPPEGDGRGTTYMLSAVGNRDQFEPLVGRLDGLIDLHRLFKLTPFQGERSLREETLGEAAFMARIAVGDGKQFWATVLDPSDVAGRGVPPTLSAFARDLRTLAVATARACVEQQKASA